MKKHPNSSQPYYPHMRGLLRDLGENICLFVGIYFIGKGYLCLDSL
jgi:hypothetical protein